MSAPYTPFCSERCKLLDLARWVDGKYRVAAEPVDPESMPAGESDDDSRA